MGEKTASPDIITPLGHEVFQIDTRMAGYDGITAGYLIRSDRPCLVETGTAPSAPVVRDALARLGIGAGDLATVVVTHIHLDHAGGAGDIAAMYPGAQIAVHQRGARHLADPSRLMASAKTVYGDALDRFFGVLAPVPADRIVALEDTGTIDLGGGRRLDSYYSPGHAKHHVGLVDSGTGDLYTGDAAGVYIPETGDVRPATPPPDFDLEVALATLRKFAALQPSRLLFSHYGPVTEVTATLDRSAEEIRVWVDETRRARAAGLDLDHAVAMVVERTKARYAAFGPEADPALGVRFDRISGSASNVSGIMYWLDKNGVAGFVSGLSGRLPGLGPGREQQVTERPPGTRRRLASGEGPGQLGRAVATADGQDDDRGEGVAETELGADGGAVEAAHLVHGEAVGLGLGDQRGHGLPGVVQGPRLRAAVVADGTGGDEDQRAGRPGPGLVTGGEGGEEPTVGFLAAAGDQEPPRLGVLRRRRPPGRLKQSAQGHVVELVRPVEAARAPPLGKQRVNRNRSAGGLVQWMTCHAPVNINDTSLIPGTMSPWPSSGSPPTSSAPGAPTCAREPC